MPQRKDGAALQRAYSVFEVKAADEEARTITGVATTPTPDRYGDIVVPTGATFTLPLPALWQHNSGQPVGQVTTANVTDDGIDAVITMEAPDADMPASMADELERAWQFVKRGLVRGLSIGFRTLPGGYVINPEDYTFEFREWEWLELSLVTIPANAESTIQNVRMFGQVPATDGEIERGCSLVEVTDPVPGVIRLDADSRRRASLRNVTWRARR